MKMLLIYVVIVSALAIWFITHGLQDLSQQIDNHREAHNDQVYLNQ